MFSRTERLTSTNGRMCKDNGVNKMDMSLMLLETIPKLKITLDNVINKYVIWNQIVRERNVAQKKNWECLLHFYNDDESIKESSIFISESSC